MTPLEILVSTFTTAAVIAILIIEAPNLRDRIRRWYQIRRLSPRAGEIGILVEPPFEDIEALLFKMSRTMFPEARVPYGSVVFVIETDSSSARVLWGDQIAVLPRRWLRRPKI
jgi:hypothetical protein